MMNKYGFGKIVSYTFDEALAKVNQALKNEGFGILTEIDVAATFMEKLALKMPPYRILGACNPSLAHQALEAEPSIGLLLPCNVVVRMDSHNNVHVEFMDPDILAEIIDKSEIAKVAIEVKRRLEKVMNAL